MIHENEPIIIGEINFVDNTITEDQVGQTNLGSWGLCKVKVYEQEGTIPHFHIDSKNGEKKACICIYTAQYFNHGPEYSTLGSIQRKQLDQWLGSMNRDKEFKGKTYWETIDELWRANNSSYRVPSAVLRVKPNYRNLEEYK